MVGDAGRITALSFLLSTLYGVQRKADLGI